MARKNVYDEASVIRTLSKKGSIKIDGVSKTIEVAKNQNDVGNGSWGKIDYLTKVHHYVVVFVDSINKKFATKKSDDEDNITNRKAAKREAKFNMATMTKAAMRKAKTK